MPDRILGDVDHVPAPQRHRPRLYAHVAVPPATQPQRYVLAEEDDQSAISSRWLACEQPVEVRP